MKLLMDFFQIKNKKDILFTIVITLVLVFIGWLLTCGVLKVFTILFNGTFDWGKATIVYIVLSIYNTLKGILKKKFEKHRT